MSDEFSAPASSEGIKYPDLKGSLLLIEPTSIESMTTAYGESTPVRGRLTVLDGAQAGTVYNDTLIFPKVLQSQLRSEIGKKVLGRLGQGNAKAGQSAPWRLEDATDADKSVARAHLAKLTTAPF